ncbi:hypothetical protein [Sorangium sp. So ce1097]|uniref:hypothetical protein n=1 Tax=Sorangium sp. So ce1097 TaxID=3133330 RepID=UPI003F626369
MHHSDGPCQGSRTATAVAERFADAQHEKITADQVKQWIAADRANVAEADKEFVKYTSLGPQQSAEEVIWDLPNGLQGYSLWGGFNQRRVDAFVNIVRDPRITREDADAVITSRIGFASTDRRLNTGSACIGCHADGMNRGDNDLRDWLDGDRRNLPAGEHGVDGWINDEATVAQVRELYPPSTVMRQRMEDDRKVFLSAMAKIKREMILGPDKNVYVEPAIWTIEWAQKFYKYAPTRSN